MLTIRPSSERGHADHGWLDSYHSFSFADYHDPRHMGFRSLRVINEDRVAPGRGFSSHPHRDMEIISYVLEGELGHQDNMGNGSVIRPGDIQLMSAGSGVIHSEQNHSEKMPVHFLQIWIHPEQQGLKPGYQQTYFPVEEKRGRLRLIVSPDGHDGSVTIHQDACLYATVLDPGQEVVHRTSRERYLWVQVVSGSIRANATILQQGDGAAVSDETQLTLTGQQSAEVLLFDLA
jgi:redox-sensitive bicupin YhaK (pirin superfamily)